MHVNLLKSSIGTPASSFAGHAHEGQGSFQHQRIIEPNLLGWDTVDPPKRPSACRGSNSGGHQIIKWSVLIWGPFVGNGKRTTLFHLRAGFSDNILNLL